MSSYGSTVIRGSIDSDDDTLSEYSVSLSSRRPSVSSEDFNNHGAGRSGGTGLDFFQQGSTGLEVEAIALSGRDGGLAFAVAKDHVPGSATAGSRSKTLAVMILLVVAFFAGVVCSPYLRTSSGGGSSTGNPSASSEILNPTSSSTGSSVVVGNTIGGSPQQTGSTIGGGGGGGGGGQLRKKQRQR